VSGPAGRREARFFAWVLIAGGALVVLLCGSCTALFGGSAALEMANCAMHQPPPAGCDSNNGLGPAIVIGALVVGGVPTLVGAVGIFIGLRLRRAPPPPLPPPGDTWSS
jgi:hypothetical protein